MVAEKVNDLRQFAADFGRPAPSVTAIAPRLSADAAQARADLAEHAAAGVERVIMAPTGAGWERDYRLAASLRDTAVRA